MFDIGFWELTVIGVVALLVIGPERLPAVARTVGVWVGKAKRFVGSVQADINREIVKSEELKRLLEEQSKIKELHQIIEQTVDDTRQNVSLNAPLKSHNPKPMPRHNNNQSNTQDTTNATHDTTNATQDTINATHDTTNESKPPPVTSSVNDQTK